MLMNKKIKIVIWRKVWWI